MVAHWSAPRRRRAPGRANLSAAFQEATLGALLRALFSASNWRASAPWSEATWQAPVTRNILDRLRHEEPAFAFLTGNHEDRACHLKTAKALWSHHSAEAARTRW